MIENQIHTKADRMAGITFSKPEKSSRGMVRVQIKGAAGKLRLRKWNYVRRAWGKWEPL